MTSNNGNAGDTRRGKWLLIESKIFPTNSHRYIFLFLGGGGEWGGLRVCSPQRFVMEGTIGIML